MKSFYDWCIENNKEKYLDLWDYNLNKKSPKEVSHTTKEYYYFKCANGIHNSYKKGINNLIHSKDLVCLECNSFYQWCINNECQNIIDCWSDKNINDIHSISYGSNKKCIFIVNGIEYISSLSNITRKNRTNNPIKKYYNSLGYYLLSKYGENAIERYWSNKNKISPFYYDKGSDKKVWIKCIEKEYHDDYLIHCYNFTCKAENRCPMCSSKIIHPQDSFAQYQINKYGKDWLSKYWLSDNTINPWKLAVFNNDEKIHIQCMKEEYHKFWITPANYSLRDFPCPYCKRKILHKNDSLGFKYPEIINIWSDKNTKTPFEYAEYSHEKIWLKCENGIHSDYQKVISNYTYKRSFTCPKCTKERNESSLEIKVKNFLKNYNYFLKHEYECTILPKNPLTNFPLPFDNEVVDLKLIIEVHGIQHYELNGWHITQSKSSGRTPEEEFEYQKYKDNYKKNYALEHGYFYLEIPYWSIDDESYTNLINNKIKEIEKFKNI